jgi:hypothetical protein
VQWHLGRQDAASFF